MDHPTDAQGSNRGGPPRNHQCPLCRGPLFIKNSVEAESLVSSLRILSLPIINSDHFVPTLVFDSTTSHHACDLEPLSDPPRTLLDLHCALLT
jgi:hypothetical protein